MSLKKGTQVYVSRRTLDLDDNDISPFYRTAVYDRKGKSVRVSLPDGTLSKPIASSKVALNFGVLIIRIGDFNEDGLLDPLAKSILQYCRMLLPGDSVRLIELRSINELNKLWFDFHRICEQVVLIWHGSREGFLFGKDDVSAEQLVNVFSSAKPSKKEFISLGCNTGYADFGKVFSRGSCVSHFLAPFHSVHGCVASLFTQSYLHDRLLAAFSTKIAFNHARQNLIGAASFRLWKDGNLLEGQK